MYVYGEAKGECLESYFTLCPIPLVYGFSLTLRLTISIILVGYGPLVILLSVVTSVCKAISNIFYMYIGDMNTDPYICTATISLYLPP